MHHAALTRHRRLVPWHINTYKYNTYTHRAKVVEIPTTQLSHATVGWSPGI